jgi:hypothetical protein
VKQQSPQKLNHYYQISNKPNQIYLNKWISKANPMKFILNPICVMALALYMTIEDCVLMKKSEKRMIIYPLILIYIL